MTQELQTITDHIRYSFSCMNESDVYCGHGTDNTWDEAVALVLQTLHLPWDFSVEYWASRVTQQEREQVIANLNRRIRDRVPLAYITNRAYFCGLEFYVDERTLVPRSPIAELIDSAFQPWLLSKPAAVLDLCTGSGCIGIALALCFDEAEVDLVDISPDALDVANINIENYSLNDRVVAIESDCVDGLGVEFHNRYDLIVTNPPYVDEADLSSMPDEFHQEPMLGLASGSDGLDFTRRLLAQASHYLTASGVLIAEVGNSWEALEAAFPDLEFTWLEFEHGGHGVFMLSADQLRAISKNANY